jgi:pilus assembly protein Flp/PilA
MMGVRAVKNAILRLIIEEDGATAIEYGMIAALIAVAIIASLQLVGSSLSTKLSAVAGNLN